MSLYRSAAEKGDWSLREAIEAIRGANVRVTGRIPVSGGDINSACVLELSDGSSVFMKSNRRARIDMFRAEAAGLEAMRATDVVRVPEVYAVGTEGDEAFLLMERIEAGPKRPGSLVELGRMLAKMHSAPTQGLVPRDVQTSPLQTGSHGGTAGHAEAGQESILRYGFMIDNYIGSTAQINEPRENWVDFFSECRLRPQFRMADPYFDRQDRKKIDALLGKLARYLTEPVRPALLHGDLWAGNYMVDAGGEPWLIDPATYVGHPEADLAMTELFGGFDRTFYDAYREVAGIDPGYPERRDLYNLYHLLNHLNLFGGGYLGSVRSIVARYA